MNTLFRRVRAGFTLLEVMVSTAIMVIIVLTVVTIASDTLRVYDRAVADLSTQSESRGVLDAMENDFSTAMLRSDGRCWMEVVVPGSTDAPGVPGPVGNLQAVDHPIVMLFGAPADRPRYLLPHWPAFALRFARRQDPAGLRRVPHDHRLREHLRRRASADPEFQHRRAEVALGLLVRLPSLR
jgi:prepilin-type N-terminal cleavage/methylation domain-containing protein